MVDPLDPDDQSKITEPQFESPAGASDAPCLPEQEQDGGKEEATNGSPEKAPEPGPEQSPQAGQPQDCGTEQAKLHLDLYNFDSPAAEGSRYVLTSPRSLEACARCGVKPVELLPRPLSDFAREAPARSMRVATGMFEVYEKDRHAKLRQCRDQRERIVQEEKKRLLQTALNGSRLLTSKTQDAANAGLPEQTHGTVTAGRTPKASPATSGPSKTHGVTSSRAPPKNTPQGSEHLSTPTSSASSSTKASSEQALKAGSESSGHTLRGAAVKQSKVPVTEPAGPTQGSTTAKTVQPIGATVSKKSSPTKSAHTFPRSTPKPSSFPRMPMSLAPIVSKSAAQSPANGVTGPFAQHNGHVVSGSRVRERSHSLESLQRRQEGVSSSTASTTTTTTCASSESASSSYSWEGTRDPWGKSASPRARALATFNSLMGRSLSLGDLSHSPQTTQKVERIVKEVKRRGLKAVPERDRKIAALMLARYQEEDIMSQTRYVAHLQWDSERRLEELRREREEREKQRAVLQCHRAWHSQVSTRQRRLSQQEREAAAVKLRQAAESEERRREQAEQQERSRLQKVQQAAREERQKKSAQEQNLKALEEEREAMLEQERLLLREKLTIAELKRQEREHQVQEERRGLNRAEKRRHAALTQEIARREADEREEVRRAAQEKLSRSQGNYEQIQERRGQELREKARREEQQIQKARKAAERRERHQKEQVEARAREAEKRAQQAALLAEERAREKAQRAVQSRQEKERLQRLNRQKVEEEERQRRLELLQSIERKLEKSEQIFREKRAVLESARSVARASFHVRDRVREETNMRTFDKMALEAQLKAGLDEK
ncbi:coiled-coil domain-containing protein 177 [Brachyhypopomus gauderio]|uniref:coiled-coil domain-containing protein 177 n=1 Tax=Brachyhypopomus gauderio TaxID=698409 RepID=UPI0040437374